MDAQIQVLTLLSHWITMLWQALPAKLAPTLLELLIGSMIGRDGHITSALLAIRYQKSWTTYYKAIEEGRFSWMALAKQWLRLLLNLSPDQVVEFVIDDFLTPRSSPKAPSTGVHYDHAKRPNRPRFISGQLRVSLAVHCSIKGRTASFPLLFRLMRKNGNRTKLDAARLLMSVLLRWLPVDRRVNLLLDAWYMKAPLLLPLITKGVTLIGQMRRDTALFLEPVPPKEQKRGRPRKYGQKITLDNIRVFCPLQHRKIFAYGRERLFQFYEIIVMVRFLKGHSCRIVWCRSQKDDAKWSKWHLLLSTDPAMNGCDLIEKYARRWWTESMFNEIKNLFGLKNAWEQSRQTLARWTMILNLAYGLPRLLALQVGPEVVHQLFPIPWRQNRPATAGWVTLFIARYFRNSNIRVLWNRKSRKFDPPMHEWMEKLRQVA